MYFTAVMRKIKDKIQQLKGEQKEERNVKISKLFTNLFRL